MKSEGIIMYRLSAILFFAITLLVSLNLLSMEHVRQLQLECHSCIFSIAVSDNHVVTGSDDNKARMWDLKTGALLHTLDVNDWVYSVAISGNRVVTGARDSKAKISDLETGELLHTLAGHTAVVRSIAISGNRIVTGSWDKTAKIGI